MVKSRKEMAHILGLKDYLFDPYTSNAMDLFVDSNEGWQLDAAMKSIQKRFHKLSASPANSLNFQLVSDTSTADISKKIKAMTHGDYHGFSAGWWTYAPENLVTFLSNITELHAYTIHAVKEGNKTHFIYVNRGESHYDYAKGEEFPVNPAEVLAFTAKTEAEAAAMSKELFSAARSFNPRQRMSEFMSTHQINLRLSNQLKKESHKVGNCTIANSNISWHFQLASDYMKDNSNATFAEAYKETQEQYRQMRLQDRKEAFQYLLHDKNISKRNYLYNYFQVINSFITKDFLNPGQNNFQTLIDNFDQKTFKELMIPLLSDNFSNEVDAFIEDRIRSASGKVDKDFAYITMRNNLYFARNKILILAMKKLDLSEQEALIKNDISLLKGAKPGLQEKYLKEDLNKYCLFTSPDDQEKVKKYLEFNNGVKIDHKTSGDLMLARGSAKKQAEIDNKLNVLSSYLFMDDKENVKNTFQELCKICSERRFNPFGDKYSSDTNSTQWLIQKLQSNDPIIEELREKLGIKAKDVKSTVEGIIAKQNRVPEKTVEFKKLLQAQNGSEKETKPEKILDETRKSQSP